MIRAGFALLLTIVISLPAAAQQTARSAAAVQPGKGVFVFREYFEYASFNGRDGQPDVDQYTVQSILGYGVTRDFTVMAHLPFRYRNLEGDNSQGRDDDSEWGLEDLKVMGQYRFWQHDSGPINTQRAVVFGGVELPSGDDTYSSDSVDPFFGLAYTHIYDRHGFNVAGQYKWNTGDSDNPVTFGDSEADAIRLETAYLYRLSPERYTASTTASWYLTNELHFRYETNGDAEVHFAPGVMYEAATTAIGVSVGFPIWEDVEKRPLEEVSVLLEWRLLF